MTLETYKALADLAFKRIEQDWTCTDAERAVLNLVNELSFVLGQSLALIPCLGDFAAATGLHKSTISRAVRSALKKGYLQIVRRRDEILYSVCTDTPANTPSPDGAEESKESAIHRLVKLNEERLQGKSDGNGQQRLPGIFESEELHAPAQAFAAMLQQDLQAAVGTSLSPPAAAPAPPAPAPMRQCHVTISEIDDRLSRLRDSMDLAREAPTAPAPVRRSSVTSQTYEQQWLEMSRGLSGDALYALERLREECQLAGPREEASFYQWRFKWRKRAMHFPRQCAEAVGVCKAMRQEGNAPKHPGAFVYRTLQSVVGVADQGV